MSAPILRRTLDAVRGLLVASFNETMAEVAINERVEFEPVDWNDETQYVETYYAPGAEDISPLDPRPLSIAVSTGNVQGIPGGFRSKGVLTAAIELRIRFYHTVRNGQEGSTEAWAAAIDDALLTTIDSVSLSELEIMYGGQYTREPDPLVQLADGYRQDVTYTFIFEVTA
jgi:hypothetical protein